MKEKEMKKLLPLLLFLLVMGMGCEISLRNRLDPQTAAKIEALERENKALKGEIDALRGQIDSLNTVIATKEVVAPAEILPIEVPALATATPVIPEPKMEKFEVVGHFNFSKMTLAPEFKAELDRIGEICKTKKVYIEIKGYSDPQGNKEYNKNLSRGRAEAARDAILSVCDTPHSMTVIGMGSLNLEGVSNKEMRKVVITVEEADG
jgi:outer membrane protein OmpA-like peptidoglycan-associated protein